jgi:hypothetical protein
VWVSSGCGWWFVTLIWVAEDKVLLWLRVVEGSKSACTCVLVVIVGCDRCWFRIVDRSVGLMCRSSRWWVCRCDWLRRRCWKLLSLMMNSADEQFFSNQNSTLFFFFFLDQSRVKYKHMNRLIVRTIKSHALIPNLMRDNK